MTGKSLLDMQQCRRVHVDLRDPEEMEGLAFLQSQKIKVQILQTDLLRILKTLSKNSCKSRNEFVDLMKEIQKDSMLQKIRLFVIMAEFTNYKKSNFITNNLFKKIF